MTRIRQQQLPYSDFRNCRSQDSSDLASRPQSSSPLREAQLSAPVKPARRCSRSEEFGLWPLTEPMSCLTISTPSSGPAASGNWRSFHLFMGKDFDFIAVYEIGKAYGLPNASRLPTDAVAGIVINTIFGPVLVGGAYGDTGHHKFFFNLGQIF